MRKAEPLAGLGGLALIVSQFLSWYGPQPGSFPADVAVSVGRSYGLADLVLILLGLLALAVPLTSVLTKGPAKAIRAAVLASALGWIAIVIVAWRLLTIPDEFAVPDIGIWVALAASVIAWVGSWLSLRDESTPGAVVPDMPRYAAP